MTTKYISQFTDTLHAPFQRQPNARQHILVVEDDRFFRRLNSEVLICSGYQVDTAKDGAVAWGQIQRENYDLIVTDNDMPNMTGIELLQELHEARLTLPVIMATGTFPEHEMNLHPWLRIDAALFKPYTVDELLGTVKEVLRAIAASRGEIAPPPNWHSEPQRAASLRL
jgi:DNA-binding response OmpR family regulator